MNSVFSRFFDAIPSAMRMMSAHIREAACRRRVRKALPGVHIEWPTRFEVDDWTAVSFGPCCLIGAFSEIVVLHRSPCSPIPGELIVSGGVHFGMGVNVRAAGGSIRIGTGTQIGQHVHLIASNHRWDTTKSCLDPSSWDSKKTGVVIGESCWIGAGAIILPGVEIGSGSVIGAGAVVTRHVPPGEIWGGNPARPLKQTSAATPRP